MSFYKPSIKLTTIHGKVVPAGLKGAFPQYPTNKSEIKLRSWAFPGGYPLAYLTRKDDVLCQHCAQNALDGFWDRVRHVGTPVYDDKTLEEAAYWEEDFIPVKCFIWEQDGDDDYCGCGECGHSVDMSESDHYKEDNDQKD